MVEPALVLVERFAVVAGEDDDRVVGDVQFFQAGEQLLDTGVHVGDRAVVLRHDVAGVGHPRRHPRLEELGERRKVEHGPHAVLGVQVRRVGLPAGVKQPVERRRRQVRRVRVHVAQKQEERLVAGDELVEQWQHLLVEPPRLVAGPLLPRHPRTKVQVLVEPAIARLLLLALEADAYRGVAPLLEHFRQRAQVGRQRLAGLQRHHPRRHHVHAGEHRAIRRRGRDVRRVAALEEHAPFGQPVQVRRGQAVVAITAQVVRAQRIHRHHQQVGTICRAGATGGASGAWHASASLEIEWWVTRV